MSTWQLKLKNWSFLMTLLAMLSACAATATQESAGEYVDDTVITTKVLAQLAKAPETSALDINVETFKGVVQLSGFVDNRDEVARAVEIARGVKGVIRVENRLSLKAETAQIER